ncbi:MAG: hypothetical protein DQL93_0040 (endogenous virus) [Lactobacillus phage ViSo-2018b]|nr:MAG: hypothetical protein DQL93_0040 [Lactobacillus phage ViSo-2018b]
MPLELLRWVVVASFYVRLKPPRSTLRRQTGKVFDVDSQ